MKRRCRDIPVETYHGVPRGWRKGEILAAHRQLRGGHDIDGPHATEPGAPRWMPDRQEWLQYRATIRRIADGARAGDAACIELAVRYIELNHIGSYSGYLKSLLGRSLKHAALESHHHRRLHQAFSQMALAGECRSEFKEYVKLWRRFMTEGQRQELISKLSARDGEIPVWLVSPKNSC